MSAHVQRRLRVVQRFGAGVVALAAIALAVWEGYENRRHNHLSVIPKIDATRNRDLLEQSFELVLASNGLGPAVVRNMQVFVDGALIADHLADGEQAWQAAYPLLRDLPVDVLDAYFSPGDFLVPGQTYTLLRVRRHADAQPIDGFRELSDRFDVAICYCSVYADQCATESLGVSATASQRCP